METLLGDFHEGDSSFDELVDFDEVDPQEESSTCIVQEKDEYYRTLDEY